MLHRLPLLLCLAASACAGRALPVDQYALTDGSAAPEPRPLDLRRPEPTVDLATDLARPPFGTICHTDADCSQGRLCLLLPWGPISVCTETCELYPSMPGLECPGHPAVDCAGDLLDGKLDGRGYCFRRCTPRLGGNDCPAPLACRPESGAKLGAPDESFCAMPACTADADCPMRTAKPCDTQALSILACPAGQICAPFDEHTTGGRCAKASVCDHASGLCGPHQGTAAAQVGDPCQADSDCAPTMRCLMERDTKGLYKGAGLPCSDDGECCSRRCQDGSCSSGPCLVHYRNGYCSVVGCASGTDWKCPAGSVCNMLYPGGQCQRTCAPSQAAGCRGNVGDLLGDYECRAWHNLSLAATGLPVAPEPVCDLGPVLPCDPSLDCSDLGLPGNPTQMSCRDLQGKVLADKHDPMGLCLDNTASGAETR